MIVNDVPPGTAAYGDGGGIFIANNAFRVNLVGSSIVTNANDADGDSNLDAGGGGGGVMIESGGSPAVVAINTLIADNLDSDDPPLGSPDCEGVFAAMRHSLIGVMTAACTVAGSSENNIINVDPMLLAFGDRGGPVPTIGFEPTSDAANAADNALCPATDARGLPRVLDLVCDIGAWESGHQPTFDPKVSIDLPDDLPGDGVCGGGGPFAGLPFCALRGAAEEADALAQPTALIRLDGHTFVLTDPSAGDLDFVTAGRVTIAGAGARATSIDATNDRVIDVDPLGTGAEVVLSELAVRSGRPGSDQSGGNLRVGGNGLLRLLDVAVTGGNADRGGGIGIEGDADAEIVTSTLFDNEARDGGAQGGPGDGGGIWHGSTGQTTLDRTTIGGNRADRHGGGLAVEDGSVVLDHVTLADNVADDDDNGTGDGGGLWQGDDELIRSGDSLVAPNVDRGGEAPDCFGAVDSDGFNLVGVDTLCSFVATGDQTGSLASPLDPGLEPLGDNGGGTDTHLPTAGGPLVDAAEPVDCSGTDQIGNPRPIDGDGDTVAICDVGAVELGGPLFEDGFESGDTSAWSSTVP